MLAGKFLSKPVRNIICLNKKFQLYVTLAYNNFCEKMGPLGTVDPSFFSGS